MESLYYGTSDFEVSELPHRKVMDEIKMLMATFDCVLPDNSAIYCSGDVTTGKQYYEILKKHGVPSGEALKVKVGAAAYKEMIDDLVERNIKRGIDFTEKVRQRGHTNLINPGPLVAPGFEQQHYHYLWEWVIIKKVCESHFNEDWEYSNGCTLEYAISTRKGIPRLDYSGNVLELPQAIEKVERAMAELRESKIQIDMLECNLARLKELSSNND